MKTVYKYSMEDDHTVKLPVGAEILTVRAHRGRIYVWALVDMAMGTGSRTIRISGTGQILPDVALRYISTIHSDDVAIVMHAFEELA